MAADSTRRRAPALTTIRTRFDRQAQRARLHRVEMAVFDRRTFTGQLALVEICDVVVVRVEQVVSGERDREALADAIAQLEVDERRRIGTHAVVLDERRLAEVAEARAAEPAARVLQGDAERGDAFDRARNVVARRIEFAEAAVRPGEVGIEREPFARASRTRRARRRGARSRDSPRWRRRRRRRAVRNRDRASMRSCASWV